MRFGIDARTLLNKNYTGIARCVYEDIHAWIKLYPQHEFFLFSSKRLELDIELPDNWHIIDNSKMKNGKIWFLFELPALVKKNHIDVFWGPSFALPRRNAKTKYYVTVHDLALFKFRGIGEWKNAIRIKSLTKKSCENADGVITISRSTAEDVHKLLGIPKDKIFLSYIGGLPSDFSIKEGEDLSEVNNKLIFKEEYFLFISTIEPRKNVTTIIEAYERYRHLTGSNMKLVLAGKKGWKCENIYRMVENSEYRNDIVMPGYITDKDKAYLLSNASAFVFPSLYEGFGIPILEAFAYGIPVITTKVSSMPEVAGDAAFYLDNPLDVQTLAELMGRAADLDKEQRNALSEKMHKRLELFSWDKNAKELMDIMTKSNDGKGINDENSAD